MSMTSGRESDSAPTPELFRKYAHAVHRIVEEQYRISTDRLTDGPAEQDVLELVIGEVKPSLPAAAASLHHLLGTPFRYGYWKETRFRRASERPGVFYASEKESTAVAEAAFYLMRFFAAAPGVVLPTSNVERFGFSIPVKVDRALDLAISPLDKSRSSWTNGQDYTACQDFASAARTIEAQLIRYESVRDHNRGANVAIFDPSAFQKPVPNAERAWHFRFKDRALTAFGAGEPTVRYDFTFAQFELSNP